MSDNGRSSTEGRLPDGPLLEKGLATVLGVGQATRRRLTILLRRRNVHSSTSLSEFVTCRLPDGSMLELFCKYGASAARHSYGHRRGTLYEALVYQHLLRASESSVPSFFGVYASTGDTGTWLIIEHLKGSLRLNRTRDSQAIVRAARWIGDFHRQNEEIVAADEMSFLTQYDHTFYEGWFRRTMDFAAPLRTRHAWIGILCTGFAPMVDILLAAPRTVVHGECYPENILVRDRAIYPIDWESTAVAPGEIDLASLTERWPSDVVEQCVTSYARARWPEGDPPHDFGVALSAARLYLHLRWLGDRPERTMAPDTQWRFGEALSLAEGLGVI